MGSQTVSWALKTSQWVFRRERGDPPMRGLLFVKVTEEERWGESGWTQGAHHVCLDKSMFSPPINSGSQGLVSRKTKKCIAFRMLFCLSVTFYSFLSSISLNHWTKPFFYYYFNHSKGFWLNVSPLTWEFGFLNMTVIMADWGVIKINKSCSLSLKSSWPTEFWKPRDDF